MLVDGGDVLRGHCRKVGQAKLGRLEGGLIQSVDAVVNVMSDAFQAAQDVLHLAGHRLIGVAAAVGEVFSVLIKKLKFLIL